MISQSSPGLSVFWKWSPEEIAPSLPDKPVVSQILLLALSEDGSDSLSLLVLSNLF